MEEKSVAQNEAQQKSCAMPHGCSIAREVADDAVARVFAIFGVDINDAAKVKDFQKTLWFGENLRLIWWKLVMAFAVSIGTSLASAILLLFTFIFKTK